MFMVAVLWGDGVPCRKALIPPRLQGSPGHYSWDQPAHRCPHWTHSYYS